MVPPLKREPVEKITSCPYAPTEHLGHWLSFAGLSFVGLSFVGHKGGQVQS